LGTKIFSQENELKFSKIVGIFPNMGYAVLLMLMQHFFGVIELWVMLNVPP